MPKYFYVVTMHSAEVWIDYLNKGKCVEFIGTKHWPYTRAQARKLVKEEDGLSIYQFALPFYNFIKQVK